MGPLSFRQTRHLLSRHSRTRTQFFTAVFPPILPTYGTCANFFRTVGAFYDALFFDNLPFSHTRAQSRTHTHSFTHAHSRSHSHSAFLSPSLSLSHTHTHTQTQTTVSSKRVGRAHDEKCFVKSYQNASVATSVSSNPIRTRRLSSPRQNVSSSFAKMRRLRI